MINCSGMSAPKLHEEIIISLWGEEMTQGLRTCTCRDPGLSDTYARQLTTASFRRI